MVTEEEEALHLQVILKAEEASITFTEEQLPHLIRKARRAGAPFRAWEFRVVCGRITARGKYAKTGRPKKVRTKTIVCPRCNIRYALESMKWNGHKYICKDCMYKTTSSSDHMEE